MPDAAAKPWGVHAREVLARSGRLRSGVRDRVIDLLAEQRCALSAQDIEHVLRQRGRPVGRATVYRTLELLVEQGLAGRVEVGEGIARYEPLDPGGDHHHHLVCRSCGRLVAFDDPGLERAIKRLGERLELQIDEHEVLLRGACERCRAPAAV
jgi:Fur family transcriptional regulator, ferric uptake regulator